MEPSLKQIRYFIAVANAGQISRGAMDLNVSQSVVTTAIKSLEEIVGTPLFERHSNGVTLTYEGDQFLGHARHIVESVEEAVRIPRKARQSISGTINLAVTYTVAGYFLPKPLAGFQRAFPGVTLNLFEADRATIEESLVTRGCDLAVMLTSNIVNHEDISHSVLLRSPRRLWVGAHHPFLQQKTVGLKEISEASYIMLTVDEASNTALKYWSNSQYQPNTVFRTSSVEAVRSMVANGMGVSVLSDMVYRPWSLEGRRVEIVDVLDPIPTMDVGLAWPKSALKRTDAVSAFIDFMHLTTGVDIKTG